MAGETVKSEAICLGIRPWSRTSHIVSWLTPTGKVTTVVKGAVRPKSAFLGQYDANYTCELVYYSGGRGDLHALRECVPVRFREGLRADYRAAMLAEYFRFLCARLAPLGPEAAAWYRLLSRSLDDCMKAGNDAIVLMLEFELEVLRLAGLAPDFSGYDRDAPWSEFSVSMGSFASGGGERRLRINRDTAVFLEKPTKNAKNATTPLDAARVIGVFYQFHLDCVSEVRRSVLRIISVNESGKQEKK